MPLIYNDIGSAMHEASIASVGFLNLFEHYNRQMLLFCLTNKHAYVDTLKYAHTELLVEYCK